MERLREHLGVRRWLLWAGPGGHPGPRPRPRRRLPPPAQRVHRPAVREQGARDWCRWEDELLSNEEGWRPNPRYDDPAFRMAFARIVTHYFHHHAWPAAELHLVATGHAGGEEMTARTLEATNRFARLDS